MRFDRYLTHYVISDIKEEDKSDLEKIKKSLSVWDETYFKYVFSAFLEDEDENKLIIPSGYPFTRLKQTFPYSKFYSHRAQSDADNYRVVKNYEMINEPRNIKQVKAINYLKNRDSQYYLPQKYLSLPTGEGKTYCVISYCQFCKRLPIIFVDQEALLKQWKAKIMEHAEVEEREIYIISGTKSVNKLMNMDEEQLNEFKYFIAIHRTFNNLFNNNPSKVTELFNKVKFGLKIYDEAHIEWKNIFYIDSVTNTETIYLSATPEKANPTEQKVYNNIFKDVSLYITKRKDEEKFLNGMIYSINTKSTLKNQTDFINKKGFDVVGYSKYLSGTNAIKEVIEDLLPKLFVNDFNKKRKLVFTFKLIDQLKVAKTIIEEYLSNVENDLFVNILDGSTKNKEEVLNNSDIIITTDKSFMKGIDIVGLEYLVNFVPIGSRPNLIQLAGRLRKHPEDKKVFFIDVVDVSVPDLVKMKDRRLRTLKEICKKIYLMNGPSNKVRKDS